MPTRNNAILFRPSSEHRSPVLPGQAYNTISYSASSLSPLVCFSAFCQAEIVLMVVLPRKIV